MPFTSVCYNALAALWPSCCPWYCRSWPPALSPPTSAQATSRCECVLTKLGCNVQQLCGASAAFWQLTHRCRSTNRPLLRCLCWPGAADKAARGFMVLSRLTAGCLHVDAAVRGAANSGTGADRDEGQQGRGAAPGRPGDGDPDGLCLSSTSDELGTRQTADSALSACRRCCAGCCRWWCRS